MCTVETKVGLLVVCAAVTAATAAVGLLIVFIAAKAAAKASVLAVEISNAAASDDEHLSHSNQPADAVMVIYVISHEQNLHVPLGRASDA